MKRYLLLLAGLAVATAASADDHATRLALARETIAAMHADKMFDAMAGQMKQMAGQLSPLPASATPEQRKKFEEIQAKALDLSMGSIKSLMAKMDEVYANVYSEAELRAMKAFFVSPEGQSMLAKQPQVMAQVMPLVQEMQRDLLPKMKQLAEDAKANP
ncbi:MAG TPA: DUF2059 domain-containing protein [Lacunisphaera sp.]|jgi:hypothetical protein|nr:DUF2059 domain-containing protein [Lacunisphaera sp.]